MTAQNADEVALVLEKFERRIGYTFSDRALLAEALTHKSAGAANNERLEFLGDAALGYVVGRYLFDRSRQANEHELTVMRASLVKGETLAAVARDLGLGEFLALGPGERKSGGRDRSSILADAVEGVIGAVVCDGGLEAASSVIERTFGERLENARRESAKDAKTQLQELLQGRGLALPNYEITDRIGRDHAIEYVVECRVASLDVAERARASSRREAEKLAARRVLDRLAS